MHHRTMLPATKDHICTTMVSMIVSLRESMLILTCTLLNHITVLFSEDTKSAIQTAYHIQKNQDYADRKKVAGC